MAIRFPLRLLIVCEALLYPVSRPSSLGARLRSVKSIETRYDE
jgi:hypothetical protein